MDPMGRVPTSGAWRNAASSLSTAMYSPCESLRGPTEGTMQLPCKNPLCVRTGKRWLGLSPVTCHPLIQLRLPCALKGVHAQSKRGDTQANRKRAKHTNAFTNISTWACNTKAKQPYTPNGNSSYNNKHKRNIIHSRSLKGQKI